MSVKGLEDSFFAKEDEELMRKLRAQNAKEAKKKLLAEASGISDPGLLDLLVDEEVSGETLVAFSLVPLLVVAWADGVMEEEERAAILKATKKAGIHEGTPSHDLLKRWLEQRPEPAMFEAWKVHVGQLKGKLDAKALAMLKQQVVDHARAVAESAGGFLGIGSISKEEKQVLEELERTFD